MEHILFLDLETRSSVDLKTYGLKNYVQSDDFSILLFAWALDDQPVQCNTIDNLPECLKDALNSNCKVVIHNSIFDLTVLKHASIADIDYKRVNDTMIQAYAHALPPSLSALSRLYNLKELGKKDGTSLINWFCKPKKGSTSLFDRVFKSKKDSIFRNPKDYPAKWAEFISYAKHDVEAMRQLYHLMPRDNYPNGVEYDNYIENLRINCYGIPLDTDLINSAVDLYYKSLDCLNNQFKQITGFNITQNLRLLEYLNDHQIMVKNVQASTINALLDGDHDIEDSLRFLLKLKQMSSQVTPKKYITLQNHSYNNRIYHTLQFMGASRTGRDAGRVFQPQNLKRPSMFLHCKTDEEENEEIEKIISDVKNKTIKQDAINILSDLIRNVIKPVNKDNKIVVSDLSNIEGRTLTWLAGEEWKLQFFKDFDAKKIPHDNYVMAYSKAMQVPPENVTKSQRAIGKVMELAMGYGGGVQSFLSFSAIYNLDIKELHKNVFNSITNHLDKELFFSLDYGFRNSYRISMDEYKTCQYLKTKWRDAHKKTVQFWQNLENCFRKAIENPNKLFNLNKLNFIYQNDFLKIILPSKRKLMYYKPNIDLEFISSSNNAVKFETTQTYGGRLSENVASAVARDILYSSLANIRKQGYKIISLVHDEVITEAPNSSNFSAEKLSSLLKTQPSWALDLPLSASGFESTRYKGK